MLRFRQYEPQDRDVIQGLCEKIFGNGFEDDESLDSFIVAVLDDRIIGFANLSDYGGYRTCVKTNVIAMFRNNTISSFGIDPLYQGKGYGSQLFDYVCQNIKYYETVARCELWVGASAFGFWQKMMQRVNGTIQSLCDDKTCDRTKNYKSCKSCIENANNLKVYGPSLSYYNPLVSHFAHFTLFQDLTKDM